MILLLMFTAVLASAFHRRSFDLRIGSSRPPDRNTSFYVSRYIFNKIGDTFIVFVKIIQRGTRTRPVSVPISH